MPATLRLATFNVHHCRGMDGKVDIERTAATILETAADFIALQELDRNVKRSGIVDQPAELQELTGLSVHFFPTAQYGGGEFGLGVATRDRVDIDFRLLPKTPFDRRHGMVVARRPGLSLVATHISRKSAARAIEFPRLWSTCRRLEDPKLIAGDFNMAGPSLAPMGLAGLRRVGGFQPTFPSPEPRRQPDHVLVSRRLNVVECLTISSEASDHLPLVVEVEI